MTIGHEDLPRPIRSGLVLVDPRLGIPEWVIIMQFNPDTLSRTLTPQATTGSPGIVRRRCGLRDRRSRPGRELILAMSMQYWSGRLILRETTTESNVRRFADFMKFTQTSETRTEYGIVRRVLWQVKKDLMMYYVIIQ